MYCRNCGAKINDNALFCEKCGANQAAAPIVQEVQQPQQHSQMPTKPQKQKNGCLIAFAIVFSCLLIIGFFIVFITESVVQNTDTVTIAESIAESIIETKIPETQTREEPKETKAKRLYNVKVNPSNIEYSDNTPFLVIYYDFTNNSGSTISFSYALDVEMFQNGIECMAYEVWNDEYQRHQEQIKVQSGKTYRLRQAYRLNDTTSPVQYEIKDDDGVIYARGEIALQ